MKLAGKKILLVSVSFFDYEKAINKRLQEWGAIVDFYDDRPSNSIFYKGIIRVKKSLIKNKIDQYYLEILKNISNNNYDYFLLIKGEAIPDFFIEKVKKINPKMQTICYTFDSVEEHPRFQKIMNFFDQKFTFDRRDAMEYGMHFRPLFFIDEYRKKQQEKNKSIFDILFIGSAHTDRYRIGEQVRIYSNELNLKSYFYYYAPSKFAFYMKKMLDKNFKNFDIKKLKFQKLTHQEIVQYFEKTIAVLDINKPYQNGLTMRTFEALANEKKLITTNPDIINYPFYHPQNIFIFDRESVALKKDFFATPFSAIAPEILSMMSLDSWLQCLFIENQDNFWKGIK